LPLRKKRGRKKLDYSKREGGLVVPCGKKIGLSLDTVEKRGGGPLFYREGELSA